MMENHSYDNYFGMLGRGDGFRSRRRPASADASNPDGTGNLVHAFHMPSTCQLDGRAEPDVEREPHLARRRPQGRLRRRRAARSRWATGRRRPALLLRRSRARSRCATGGSRSRLAQTYPNRRFLHGRRPRPGIISDRRSRRSRAPSPPNGTIFDQLDAHGISWNDYFSDLPDSRALPEYARHAPGQDSRRSSSSSPTAAAGHAARPSRSSTPAFDSVRIGGEPGRHPARRGVRASGRSTRSCAARRGRRRCSSGCTTSTAATTTTSRRRPRSRPTTSRPTVTCRRDQPGGYDRYGFRVPAVVVSPFASRTTSRTWCTTTRRSSSSSRRKWNLPRAHVPRRERRRPARLPRLPRPARVPRAAAPRRPRARGDRRAVHARRRRDDPAAGAVTRA